MTTTSLYQEIELAITYADNLIKKFDEAISQQKNGFGVVGLDTPFYEIDWKLLEEYHKEWLVNFNELEVQMMDAYQKLLKLEKHCGKNEAPPETLIETLDIVNRTLNVIPIFRDYYNYSKASVRQIVPVLKYYKHLDRFSDYTKKAERKQLYVLIGIIAFTVVLTVFLVLPDIRNPTIVWSTIRLNLATELIGALITFALFGQLYAKTITDVERRKSRQNAIQRKVKYLMKKSLKNVKALHMDNLRKYPQFSKRSDTRP